MSQTKEESGVEAAPEWGVFQINDCDWWIARDAEAAKISAAALYRCKPTDEQINQAPARLTDEQLGRLMFYQEADRSKPPITFATELANRIKAGPVTEMFATTEF